MKDEAVTEPSPPLRATDENSIPRLPKVTRPNPFYTGEIDEPLSNGHAPTAGSPRGVIIFLHGGRWHDYFVKQNLPRLEQYFLKCYPYPLHIFHEDIRAEQKKAIRRIVRSSGVTFERVDFSKLPEYTTEEELSGWMKAGVQYKFQGRGYRMMCRFWAGYVWRFASLDPYDVYLRLDTDSVIERPMRQDLFRYFKTQQCQYAYNNLRRENPYVLDKLWPTFLEWAHNPSSNFSSSALRVVEGLATREGQYWGPMYYNNFEMGYMTLKRHPLYQSLFDFLDQRKPYGFLRYRWGDAPVHTLGVWAVLAAEGMPISTSEGKERNVLCNVTKSVAPYRHAALKLPPKTMDSCS